MESIELQEEFKEIKSKLESNEDQAVVNALESLKGKINQTNMNQITLLLKSL